MIEHHDQYAAAEAEGPQIEDNDDRPLYASQPRPATIRTAESILIEVQGLRAMIGDVVRMELTSAFCQGAEAMRLASLEACRKELLPDHPHQFSDDIAYDQAVRDCQKAIRGLPVPDRKP